MIGVMRKVLSLLTLVLYAEAMSQTLPDPVLNAEFSAQVKSIDEFINRFNGTESNPEVKNDSNFYRNNLIALFDYQMKHDGLTDAAFRKMISDFVQQIEVQNAKIKLTDSSMWAEAKSSVKVDGRSRTLTLLLRSETYNKDRVRWTIAGAKGVLKACGIDTAQYYAISPVEHEVHFMSLDGIFTNNRKGIMGYKSKECNIDELSVFFSFVMIGKIEFCAVSHVTFHCLEVPNYAFTIEEQGRRGLNSGWLITNLIPLSDNNKNQYINKLLHYEN